MSERLGRGVLSLSKQKWEQLPDGKRRRRAGSSDKAPDYFGTLTIEVPGAVGGEAVKMRLAGWAAKSKKSGSPYIDVSLEYDRDELRRLVLELASAPAASAPADEPTDDVDWGDLPF